MAQTTTQHGDRIEIRRLEASTALVGYTNWPGLQQVLCLETTVIEKKAGKRRQERRYAVTSLSPERADAHELLKLWRGHWEIENRVHWVRDVTFDEDRCQVRSGQAPQLVAALRNLTIALLRIHGVCNIAAGLRRHAARPAEALAKLGLPP